jgi:hypothetical protein
MGNLSVVPAIPAANGVGAPSSVAALGAEKTIHVDGTFSGAVTVEASNGKGYTPIASFQAPGRKTLECAAQDIRVVRSAATAVPGTPAVTVSGNDDGGQFAELAVGSPGASSDLKAFGTLNTIIVDISTGELTLTSSPSDGETVTIGDKTYTFQASLTDVDGNVNIGGDAAQTLDNLIRAINLGAGAGSDYAASMTANTYGAANVGATDLIMEVKLFDSRGTLRGIATTETLANGSWGAATMGKQLDGVVKIQTSEDDSVYTDLCSFQTPDQKTLEVVARYVRVNHVNNALGSTPRVSIGAINDDTAHKPTNVITPDTNISVDVSLSDKASVVLDQSITIDDLINCEVGDHLEFVIAQDGGGTFLVSWGASFLWPGGTAPVITAAANSIDKVELFVAAVDANGVATQVLGTFDQAFA